jgi:glycosyltransferase involved in cell wall biosynthesis
MTMSGPGFFIGQSHKPGQAMRVLIIIPAFNEAGNVGNTVAEVKAAYPSADMVVIDDGSRDATAAEAASAGAEVVRLPFNLGIGGAVQTGFQYAQRGGYDAAVQLDGDGQHDASFLPQLLSPVLTGQADMAIGSRFLDQRSSSTGSRQVTSSQGFQSTFSRRIGIRFFVRLINALTGARISDPTSGFRAHNRRLIAAFALHYPHDFPEPEAVVLAHGMGARIVDVPVSMRARQGGSSSIRHLTSLYYMLKVTIAILLHMIGRREPDSGAPTLS